jgi:hypothetical protein
MSLYFGILGLNAKTTFNPSDGDGRILYIVIKASTKKIDFYTQVMLLFGGWGGL